MRSLKGEMKMTLNEAFRKVEEEYLKKLFKNHSQDGLSMMARIAGISRERLIEKLYAYGIIKSNHRRGAKCLTR